MKEAFKSWVIDHILSSKLILGVLFGFIFSMYIDPDFVLGYILGISIGRSYEVNNNKVKVDYPTLIGCLIGLLITWLIKKS